MIYAFLLQTTFMHITWLGQTCVKLQTKHKEEDVNVLLDAYKPEEGEFPRNFSPEVAIFSRGQENAASIGTTAFMVDTLGEIETKGVMIYGVPGNNESIIFKLNIEGINIVHVGRITVLPSSSAMEIIGNPDILFVSVGGGKNYLTPDAAASVVTALEPRIVIPMAYQSDTDPNASPLTQFLKEIGVSPTATDKKIIIKKKDLPTDTMQLFVLEKNT